MNCGHRHFWFSRTLDYCPIHDELEMQDYCVDCGMSAHAISEEEKRRNG